MNPDALWVDTGPGARLARALLRPASWGYRAVVAGRNALFDAGVLASRPTAIPALSVGNLSVGGTGKTPIAADIASRLRSAGAHPALLLRGYGDDEARVHALLNPDVPVLTSPDRVAASLAAAAQGCDIAVLDDAFQHRWARRVVDVVLVAAEQWETPLRCLPAGRYREPLSALARASLVIVTRKTAEADAALTVASAIASVTEAPVARVSFALDELRRLGHDGESRPLSSLAGQTVIAVAGIGSPRAFALQLRGAGAQVELVSFPDHHAFTPADVSAIARRSPAGATIVCTLKDAVKLDRLWPRAALPLWYVTQRLAL
ncbi:MAG: tetraacyldisaccharide 4'-kinase, partial [Gemmatimonadota bacterium]